MMRASLRAIWGAGVGARIILIAGPPLLLLGAVPSSVHGVSAASGEFRQMPLDSAPEQSDPFAAVDACFQQELSQKGLPGGSMAIAVDNALAHTSAFGVRRRGDPPRIDTETIFRINSTTKMMGAVAVLQLVEQGKLDMHAPITQYVPELEIAPPWDPSSMTLHMLLGNAGAIPDPYLDFSLMPLVYDIPAWEIDLSGWAARLGTMHLYAPPGSFWNYSSPNFSMAAIPVERVTGLTWADYVMEHVFEPAGMPVATFDPEAVVASGNYATGHYRDLCREPADFQRTYALPGGGAYTTPTELITWTLQLMDDGGDILSPSSLQAMTTKHYKADAVPWTPRSSYGYGVFIDDYRLIDDPSRVIHVVRHPGNGRGYGTELVWAPELGFAVATLINGHSNMLGTVNCALRYVAGLETVPQRGRQTSPATWDKYTGAYAIQDVFGARWTALVTKVGDELLVDYPDWRLAPAIAAALPDPARMSQQAYDTFQYSFGGNEIVTFEPGGEVRTHAGWMRNQYFVGQRVGVLPERIELEGNGCTTLELTPAHTVDAPHAVANGLVEPLVWKAQPVSQEDPDDPTSSTFRADVPTSGALAFLNAWLFDQADDDLEMYLMQDQNEDGVFTWPDELVERLTAQSAQGIFVAARDTPGPYQIWVHGVQVAGEDSIFQLEVVAVAGEELRIVNMPVAMVPGEASSFDVCAYPDASYSAERVGLVEIDFGAPGALGRVPVYWTPGEPPAPKPAVYLPFAVSG